MQFSAKTHSKGFALLITITLLAFLVLLLVSLASLTRVETQVASNNQQLAQARQNALMALNIALGELQKYTGPDQRTTVRSDIADTTAPSYTTPNGRWTGAYGNGVPVGGFGNPNKYDETPSTIQTNLSTYYTDPSNATDPYVLKGSQARLLNWLVSGNETTTFAAAASGQITTKGTGITFSPSDPVVLGGGTALSTDTKVKSLPARILVGPNSVTDSRDYVAAPLVSVSAVTPGLGVATPIGNYAWWVGDEGTKARINLPIATGSQTPLAFVSSQRAAIELIDGKNPEGSTTATDLIGPAYPSNAANTTEQANLIKVISKNQLPMLTPASAADLTKAVKYRFHDLTGHSISVLSDTYAGGLKKDLSAVLAPDPSPTRAPLDTDFVFKFEPPPTGANVNELGLPTWGQLRSFAQTTDTNGAATPGLVSEPPAMQKQPATTLPAPSTLPVTTTAGLGPIMTYFVMGYKYVAPGGTDAYGYPAAGNRIRLAAYPIVVLWNPYTTDMLPKKYEVGIQRDNYYARVELGGRSGPADPYYAWSATNRIENRNLIYSDDTNTTDPYFRFIVDNTKGIKAGQSLVFTLQSPNKDYSAVDTTNALSDADYHPFYYVLLKDRGNLIGTNPAAAPGHTAGENIYRVGVNRSPTRTHYQGKTAAVTYFDGSWSDYEPWSWGGNGVHQAYLGDVTAANIKPVGNAPYTVSGPNYTSRKWYQSMSYQWTANLGEAPFGYNPAFPTDSAASAVIPTPGTPNPPYPDSGKWTGLVQSEGRLEVTGTLPAWRFLVKIRFQELNSSWVSLNNPRGFQSTNTRISSSNGDFTGGDPANTVPVTSQRKISSTQWPPFSVTIDPSDDLAKTRAGSDWWQSSTPTTPPDAILFEVRPGTQPLLSIGQLQHANLGWLATNPTYSIGNSMAAPFLGTQLGKIHIQESDVSSTLDYNRNSFFKALYDQSWLLNRVLWDQYFVSTVPNKETGTDQDTATLTPTTAVPPVLPNPRHIRYNDDLNPATLRNADKAAAHLLLSGGFNINSTSEQAWRAILGGTNKLSYDPTGIDASGAHAGPVYSRFSKPTTNSTTNPWLGYRRLSDAQIAQFAKSIVTEIRNRGPFISLGDFINRRLSDNLTSTLDERKKGTIQTVLDDATAGINPTAATAISFAPQYLTQADVLSTIGSGLSARSDTFIIRTYGEALDPVNSTSGTPVITGRAWCEAVVQRLPDYVDPLIAAETQLHSLNPGGNAALTLAKATNLAFGRKYKIISFRWLSSTDI